MASTSNTGRGVSGVHSSSSVGGDGCEKTTMVGYTKTLVELLRSRYERAVITADKDSEFEVSELIHEAVDRPEHGTLDKAERKKMYRRYYDVIKVFAACHLIFFPKIDMMSRAATFTISGAHIRTNSPPRT